MLWLARRKFKNKGSIVTVLDSDDENTQVDIAAGKVND
jgi:hypothetical protein